MLQAAQDNANAAHAAAAAQAQSNPALAAALAAAAQNMSQTDLGGTPTGETGQPGTEDAQTSADPTNEVAAEIAAAVQAENPTEVAAEKAAEVAPVAAPGLTAQQAIDAAHAADFAASKGAPATPADMENVTSTHDAYAAQAATQAAQNAQTAQAIADARAAAIAETIGTLTDTDRAISAPTPAPAVAPTGGLVGHANRVRMKGWMRLLRLSLRVMPTQQQWRLLPALLLLILLKATRIRRRWRLLPVLLMLLPAMPTWGLMREWIPRLLSLKGTRIKRRWRLRLALAAAEVGHANQDINESMDQTDQDQPAPPAAAPTTDAAQAYRALLRMPRRG